MKPIKNKKQHKLALAELELLMDAKRFRGRTAQMVALGEAIMAYEKKRWPRL